MLIIPAIDLQQGKCVRLAQGRKEAAIIYKGDPIEVARSFESDGGEWSLQLARGRPFAPFSGRPLCRSRGKGLGVA